MLLLDFADRRDYLVITERLHREIETHLIVAHAGATVRDGASAEFIGARDGGVDDQVTIGHQQRILPLIALAGPDEWFDEAVPECRAAVGGDVTGDAQFP